ncbi:MAG: hypothetical protein JXB00_13085 [Bacteroidales bacterium]|nr:hypothetical protein [Bacteroidales bacterium]
MPVSWIDYKGHRILYSDYRGLKSEDLMLKNLEKEAEFYKNCQFKVLSLNDYRDTFVSKSFMNKVTELGKETKDRTLKAAVLGISGVKGILLNGYATLTGQPVRAFDDEIAAKEYLIK